MRHLQYLLDSQDLQDLQRLPDFRLFCNTKIKVPTVLLNLGRDVAY